MYKHLKYYILIILIFIINIRITYSYKLNNKIYYTYDNITDFEDCENFIYIYDKNKTLKKKEVLKIKNKINLSYYCKNNICVEVDREALGQFVEIPDENGNMKIYISKSYRYDQLKSTELSYKISGGHDIIISYKCTSDSQCLTNKCIDGFCIFNEENPTEFCADIYINLLIFRYSYMHCGKAIGDICKKDKDCGSKHCGLITDLKTWKVENYCGMPPEGPSDSDFFFGFINLLKFIIAIYISLCISYIIKFILKHKIKINVFYLFVFLLYLYIYFYIF